MIMAPLSEHHRLSLNDALLTVLTILLILIVFVFAPLQAMGLLVSHVMAIVGLLAITASMLIISASPTALVLMSISLLTNIAVFSARLYGTWPYNVHLLALAWLIIAITLGTVVS